MDSFTTVLLVLVVVGIASTVLFRRKNVKIRTEDEITIAGSYFAVKGAKKAVIFLHMMPRTKESYTNLARKLREKDIASIAIDLRGHGESQGGPGGYENFSDEEHQKSIKDVKAASDFLKEMGYGINDQYVVGASIGANLALWFAVENPEVERIVLLSPGIDYKGIRTEPLIKQLEKHQKILIATSEDDERSAKEADNGEVMENNAEMCRRLSEIIPESVENHLITYKKAGHGTDMFGKEEPYLQDEIIKFLYV